ncbi:protein FAM167B isoform X1 [Amblyraja radiata]|uniref:protein FAM167B isoform X1 n=1 Tax=Amblyraja radiata TaxID=386614 RepID=UPI001403D235|nr:protein FAM167B isoform X1 [Amblyraja radiata]
MALAQAAADEEDDLGQLKALADKLKLQTRRPSFAEWQERLQGDPWRECGDGEPAGAGTGSGSGQPTRRVDIAVHSICGFTNIAGAVGWLRAELKDMQAVDQQLARRLISLRREMHRLKVEQMCHQHKQMLEEVTMGLEECEEESDLLCDIPLKAAFSLSTPLKHIGITKMNINSRRFSLS